MNIDRAIGAADDPDGRERLDDLPKPPAPNTGEGGNSQTVQGFKRIGT